MITSTKSILLALLATPVAASDCLPYASAAEAIAGNGMALTFEGFADGGSLQVFTARDGTWLVIVKTDDGRACPIITGDDHNVTLGSLL